MATNQIVELNTLVMTSKNDTEIVERLKTFLIQKVKRKELIGKCWLVI